MFNVTLSCKILAKINDSISCVIVRVNTIPMFRKMSMLFLKNEISDLYIIYSFFRVFKRALHNDKDSSLQNCFIFENKIQIFSKISKIFVSLYRTKSTSIFISLKQNLPLICFCSVAATSSFHKKHKSTMFIVSECNHFVSRAKQEELRYFIPYGSVVRDRSCFPIDLISRRWCAIKKFAATIISGKSDTRTHTHTV